MPLTIPTPKGKFKNSKIQRDQFHGGKFFAVVALAIVCAVAGANGWIPIPNASAIGLLALLGLLALIFFAANTKRAWLRNFAVILAIIVGIIIGPQWGSVWKTFWAFGWLGALLLIGAVLVMVGIAAWCSYKGPLANRDKQTGSNSSHASGHDPRSSQYKGPRAA